MYENDDKQPWKTATGAAPRPITPKHSLLGQQMTWQLNRTCSLIAINLLSTAAIETFLPRDAAVLARYMMS